MSAAPHPEHGLEELCPAGTALYELALREGRISGAEAAAAPCLLRFGLLQPTVTDMDVLEPVAAAVALQQLLRTSAERVAEVRRHEARLAQAFEPLLRASAGLAETSGETPTLRVHSGTDRINQALTEVMEEARREILCIQPHTGLAGPRGEAAHDIAYHRDQRLLDRGGRIRTLYQHTVVHLPAVHAHNERLVGDVEGRCLDELTDRLIVMDRQVAFLPADDDGTLALEVRHPALVAYFVTTFERLWRLATPMYPRPVRRPTLGGVTPRQRAIARLLTEGHTDTVIAERLGMNVRTTREHIARLATTLGSESRAQLGYLIAASGILELEEAVR
ncbi:helix-turn-helix transcriptional regulator [Streptomyces sp. NPDC008240]|uniref:helix-turn-helix transcriptional regulator n=1 Tax=Streptomyces sp. NPDC008240 TaxID=3364822 RepID=UPI0036EF1BD7